MLQMCSQKWYSRLALAGSFTWSASAQAVRTCNIPGLLWKRDLATGGGKGGVKIVAHFFGKRICFIWILRKRKKQHHYSYSLFTAQARQPVWAIRRQPAAGSPINKYNKEWSLDGRLVGLFLSLFPGRINIDLYNTRSFGRSTLRVCQSRCSWSIIYFASF